MESIEKLLEKPSIFKDRRVLSPHFIPSELPYREEHIKKILRNLAVVLRGEKPRNIFIYGKTGTGKTSTIKHIIRRLEEFKQTKGMENIKMFYLNSRMMYNSRYRILTKVMKSYYPELEKSGFGLTYVYEKLVEFLEEGNHLVLTIDEIDVVKDLDDLVYTITRVNDEVEKGSLSVVGISNKLSFKQNLDPRSRSSLFEEELVFPPYNASQLKKILMQRVEQGFVKGVVSEGAISLIAAITAQENGDARYALKLLLKAGEEGEEEGRVEEKHVKKAIESVEHDLAEEAIKTLPINQQILLYSIAKMTLANKKMTTLTNDGNYFFSGDVYKYYTKVCKELEKKPKSSRWYREYINELENLGLISSIFTGKGIRGHTRLIKLGISPEGVIKSIEKRLKRE